MNMKKLLLGSVALAALIAGPAMAADLPVKAPVYKAPPSVVYSWTGCYVGAHVGYGWGRNTNDFGNAIETGNSEGEGLPGEAGPFHHNTSGGVVGGQIGCNYQFAPNWVVGIEGEFSWSGIKGSYTAPEDEFSGSNFSRFESRNRWDGDVALRFGYTWNRHLLYGKAGVALGNFNYIETHDDFPTTHALSCGSGRTPCSVSFSKTLPGLLLGAGWEYAFLNNWSVKAEYNYINYASHNLDYPSSLSGLPPYPTFPVHDTKHIIKVGVNYKFDWGGPVVARY
jgi:outer membrane immunogenic protein